MFWTSCPCFRHEGPHHLYNKEKSVKSSICLLCSKQHVARIRAIICERLETPGGVHLYTLCLQFLSLGLEFRLEGASICTTPLISSEHVCDGDTKDRSKIVFGLSPSGIKWTIYTYSPFPILLRTHYMDFIPLENMFTCIC